MEDESRRAVTSGAERAQAVVAPEEAEGGLAGQPKEVAAGEGEK